MPTFIQYSTTEGALTINSVSGSDAGSYKLAVNVTLDNVGLLQNFDNTFSWTATSQPTDWITTAVFTINLEVLAIVDATYSN